MSIFANDCGVGALALSSCCSVPPPQRMERVQSVATAMPSTLRSMGTGDCATAVETVPLSFRCLAGAAPRKRVAVPMVDTRPTTVARTGRRRHRNRTLLGLKRNHEAGGGSVGLAAASASESGPTDTGAAPSGNAGAARSVAARSVAATSCAAPTAAADAANLVRGFRKFGVSDWKQFATPGRRAGAHRPLCVTGFVREFSVTVAIDAYSEISVVAHKPCFAPYPMAERVYAANFTEEVGFNDASSVLVTLGSVTIAHKCLVADYELPFGVDMVIGNDMIKTHQFRFTDDQVWVGSTQIDAYLMDAGRFADRRDTFLTLELD